MVKFKYARVDALVDFEANYLSKVCFNGQSLPEAPAALADYLDELGQQGWKMINAETVGTIGDYRQEVYCFERLVE